MLGFLVLFAYGIFSLSFGIRNAASQSRDLAPVYMASRLWLEGSNPYQPPGLKPWQEAWPAEAFPSKYTNSTVSSPYPPIALMNLSLLGRLDWPVARNIWLAVNLFLVFYIPWLIRRIWYPAWSASATALFVAFWMGGLGVRVTLGLGQHGLLAFAFLLTALWRIQSGKPAAGIFLALSSHKPNLAVCYLVSLAPKIPRRALLSAVFVFLALYILFFVRMGSHAAESASSFKNSLLWWVRAWETSYPGTCLLPVLSRLLGRPWAAGILLNLLRVAGLGVYFWVFRRNRLFPTDIEFGTLSLLSLWLMYHGFQDTFLLILPITALAHRIKALWSSNFRWVCLFFLVCLTGMWFTNASKLYLFFFSAPFGQLHETGLYGMLVNGYRLLIFAAFLGMLLLQLRGVRGFSDRIVAGPSE